MTGLGVLYVNKHLPEVATVFTTHATSIGRSIAGNNKPLYDYLLPIMVIRWRRNSICKASIL